MLVELALVELIVEEEKGKLELEIYVKLSTYYLGKVVGRYLEVTKH